MIPFFSVLVPVFNQVGKMEKCIESLRNQTFSDFEAIFVDDGSTDASYEILQEFAKLDGRFEIYKHEKNQSLVVARLTAMKKAKGSYIVILDSDDWLELDALEVLNRRLVQKPSDVLMFGYITEPDGTKYYPVKEDALKALYHGIDAAAIWKRCYRKEVIEKAIKHITPFYCNIGEDTFYSTVLLATAETVDCIDEALYHYDEGGMSAVGGRISPEKSRRDLQSALLSEKMSLEFLKKYHPEYLEDATVGMRTMKRFVVSMAALPMTDYKEVLTYLETLNTPETRDLFEFSCQKLLFYKNNRTKYLEQGLNMREVFLKMLIED